MSDTLRYKLQSITNFSRFDVREPELYDQLMSSTSNLPTTAVLRQRAYHVINQCIDIPLCRNVSCNNQVKWNSTTHKYQLFCCNACVHEDGSHNTKRVDTMIGRYGVSNIFKDVDLVKKARLQKLGVEHAMQSTDVKNKTKDTNLKKLGYTTNLLTPQHQANRLSKIQELGGQAEINNRISVARTTQYSGKEYWIRNTPSIGTDILFDRLHDPLWLQQENTTKSLVQIAEELGITQPALTYWFAKHGIAAICNNSQPQNDLTSFIKSVIPDTEVLSNIRSVISPFELDVYIPAYNLAFEFNGIFWHGELSGGKDKQYHQNKTNMCNIRNIRLIHVFENEWVHQQDIVKSRICNILGKNRVLHARKCKVVEIDNRAAARFLDDNHIQGNCVSAIQYAVVDPDNTIVAVMTFGKSRYNKSVEWELLRYASSLNTNVVGGAGKLFAHFIKSHNPSSVISYCDLRWGNGKLYEQLNFKLEGKSDPNYFYFHKASYTTLHSRIKFQKHKLAQQFANFNPALTEWENMQSNGYDRIWDCGNLVYTWVTTGSI